MSQNQKESKVPTRTQIMAPFWRIVFNTVLIIFDTIPILAIPATAIEFINMASRATDWIGIKTPSLTPNVKKRIFGVGFVGAIIDLLTFELLPLPSSAIIHGAQILHDIRPVHLYVLHNPRLRRFRPLTGFLNSISYRLIKKDI
jgi:hypothetical protein